MKVEVREVVLEWFLEISWNFLKYFKPRMIRRCTHSNLCFITFKIGNMKQDAVEVRNSHVN